MKHINYSTFDSTVLEYHVIHGDVSLITVSHDSHQRHLKVLPGPNVHREALPSLAVVTCLVKSRRCVVTNVYQQ